MEQNTSSEPVALSTQQQPTAEIDNIAIAPPTADIELATTSTPAPNNKPEDPYLVTFDEPFDAENPKDWTRTLKWTQTDILSATGFARIIVSTIMAPALSTISTELSMSPLEAAMSLSSFMLATAFGPLVLGPLSEIYGRRPVLHATNAWFTVFNLVCGFAETKGTLIACRFLAGFGASAIYSLAGGVLGDIWRPEQRGRSLGMYILIPLLGAAVGPIIGGFIAARSSWRWMFWSTSAFQGVMAVVAWFGFRESYSGVILRRRAERVRRETGDARYRTADERLEGERSVRRVVLRHLTRPLRLLATHPAIQCMAIMSGFGYGVLYIVLTTYADMWTQQYHQSVLISGLHYIAPALGEIIGSQIGGPLMDRIFKRLKTRANGEEAPEYHLPLLVPSMIISAAGLIIYGWAAQNRVFWLVCDIGIAINCFGSQIGGQNIQAYVIDAYPHHTGSATAASQFIRSLTAFAFPLFAPQMYRALGWGWGNSLVALMTIVIGVPGPILIFLFGRRIRARAVSSY